MSTVLLNAKGPNGKEFITLQNVTLWDARFLEAMTKTTDVKKRVQLVKIWLRKTMESKDLTPDTKQYDQMVKEFAAVLESA